MGSLPQLVELTRVRVLLFLREKEALFWVLVFPLVLGAVLGFAFRSGGVDPSRLGVVESSESAALVEVLEAVEHVRVETLADRDEAWRRLRNASLDAIVDPGEPPRFTYDPERPEGETAKLRALRALGLARDGGEPELALEPVTETGSRYVDFLFPGLLGMNIMGTGLWGIGFAIADTRQRKVLRRMVVTPMKRSTFFLSFILSRLFFLVVEVLVLVGFGAWVLDVPFRCNLAEFTALALVGCFTFAGMGLLVASRARTLEGISGLLNLVMMPMWLGSGVFFSYERFPEAVHPFLRLLPLTPLNEALRALMIDGASLASQGFELAVQAAWAGLCFALALKVFRWE